MEDSPSGTEGTVRYPVPTDHADRFRELVRRVATTPKAEYDKAEAERKAEAKSDSPKK